MRKYQAPTKEFFRLPNNIFNLGLTPIQFMLYSYLVSCVGSKGHCWPSQNTISSKTGIGTTSVQDHLKVLEKRKIIEISKRRSRSGRRNNEYTLLSLGNPEVYRDFNWADTPKELPFEIYDDLPS